jgi:hypothetical protein
MISVPNRKKQKNIVSCKKQSIIRGQYPQILYPAYVKKSKIDMKLSDIIGKKNMISEKTQIILYINQEDHYNAKWANFVVESFKSFLEYSKSKKTLLIMASSCQVPYDSKSS